MRAGLALLVLSVMCGGAYAKGDPERGKVLASTCMGCHGVNGYTNAYPTYHVPKLGSQHADYLSAALTAYQKGDRPHSTMHAQAASLTNEQIADIAAYFSAYGK